MRLYTEAEINAVVNVMRIAEVQTLGEYLRKFKAEAKVQGLRLTGHALYFLLDNLASCHL
jgi:hypothetical protein